MSVIPEKVRLMNDVEKVHYYLDRFAANDSTPNVRQEAIEAISTLLQGTDINEIFTKFNLTGELKVPDENDPKGTPASLSIKAPSYDSYIVFDLSITDRNQFRDPKPEDKRPVKSFLTDKELQEVKDGD